jgi:hypothetical protein
MTGVLCSQPFQFLFLTFKWIITEVFIEFSRLRLFASGAPDFHDYDEDDIKVKDVEKPKVESTTKHIDIEDWDEKMWKDYQKNKPIEYETIFFPCDKQSELYVLKQDHHMSEAGYEDKEAKR